MKQGIYLDETGNLLILQSYKKWIEQFDPAGNDGWWDSEHHISYGYERWGQNFTSTDSSMVQFMLRHCKYLGKL